MQTSIVAPYQGGSVGQEANRILRKCVHCGFCLATCPTYQLLGDELDSPRGRIYQIKQVLEGKPFGVETRLHLDRCLTCRSCETTCPSGVEYGRLLDLGREVVERATHRPIAQRLQRTLLECILSRRSLAAPLFGLARLVRPLLPKLLAGKITPRQPGLNLKLPDNRHSRTMLMLDGCVQPVLTPRTNQAASKLLDQYGITLIAPPEVGCCGALSHHLSFEDRAMRKIRANIDAWWPYIEEGVEAIITSASGCGVMVKDYAFQMRDNPLYAEKAERVAALARDLSEVVAAEVKSPKIQPRYRRIAFQSPCTYQHGQKLAGIAESILREAGYELCAVKDPHLCCGSAGTYSLLQPTLSGKLLENKLFALTEEEPEVIATANVGCQTHLMTNAEIPVVHWIELLI